MTFNNPTNKYKNAPCKRGACVGSRAKLVSRPLL